ncbi:adenosylcobinamide-GDP ribazoletransferase [Prochlorococcus sp. MIT 1307]|uniref:adenosylcobinamide-GDP ribazoletransferase n=1 Tax=Prochlorococcus sp. MIT 1307 TaxID=3096219 RepID=UPI002A75B4DD|nr:adenosylcobinamide-GDP ribazoletransferase [Prochlorococcus sp. MIT 1307]
MNLLKFRTLSNFTWPRDLAGAWIFYTVLPFFPWIKPRFERIARFAPLIGIVIGLVQAGLWVLLSRIGWEKESIALLTIGVGIWITGGLHLDGLMDTADGLAAGKVKCLKAMKDSRVGAGGVQALIIILLIQLAALIKLNSLVPLAIPIATFWGRCAPFWAIQKFSYLHKNGAGSFHKLHWKRFSELKATLIAITVFLLILNLTPIKSINQFHATIGLLSGVFPAFIFPELIGHKLGGHNGDSYGASVVCVETFMLLFLALFL